MIEASISDNEHKVIAEGTMPDILSELAYIIMSLHQSFRVKDERLAEVFKFQLLTILSQQGAWDFMNEHVGEDDDDKIIDFEEVRKRMKKD